MSVAWASNAAGPGLLRSITRRLLGGTSAQDQTAQDIALLVGIFVRRQRRHARVHPGKERRAGNVALPLPRGCSRTALQS